VSFDARAAELGLDLSAPPAPMANYVRVVRTGDLLFIAGTGPRSIDGSRTNGTLGLDMTVEEGYAVARSVAVQLIATLKDELGTLDRVVRVVKLLCMVNSAAGFGQQPAVANGCSDLLVEVFGDAGRHARSAVGMSGLPNGIAVEIEAIVQVRD
jgi:enamine deaminase RidA (YjgF/YER057c/UK114 family)